MKPFKKDIDVLEYYRERLLTQKEKTGDIFVDAIPSNKITYHMSRKEIIRTIFKDKKIAYCADGYSFELFERLNKNKILIYADVRISDKAITFDIRDDKYVKFCEKLSKFFVDFTDVNLVLPGVNSAFTRNNWQIKWSDFKIQQDESII